MFIQSAALVKSKQGDINKINIYTAEDLAAKTFVREHFEEYPQYLDFTKGLRGAVEEVVKRHMLLFASAGKQE